MVGIPSWRVAVVVVSALCTMVTLAGSGASATAWDDVRDAIGQLTSHAEVTNAAVQIAACGAGAPVDIRQRMAHVLLARVTPAGEGAGETYAAAVLAGELLGAAALPEERAAITLMKVRALAWHGLVVEAGHLLATMAREGVPPASRGLWHAAHGLCAMYEERFDNARRCFAQARAAGHDASAWEEVHLAQARLAERDGRYGDAFALAERAVRRWGMGNLAIEESQALRQCFALAPLQPEPCIMALWNVIDDLRASMPRRARYKDALVFLHLQDRFLRCLYPDMLGHITEVPLP